MVEISFYALSAVAAGMLLLLFKAYSTKEKLIAFIAFGAWLAYLSILDYSGLLKDFSLPPRIPLLVVIPIITLIIFGVNRKFMRSAIMETPLFLPILLQSFRILVELLIYATYQKGVFPQRATFEGLNFDIIVGISSLMVAPAVYKGLIKNRGILIWNFISLAVLSLTVYSFISTYYLTDFATASGNYKFVEFPYLLLASVLLPIAIFLHAFSLKQVLLK